MAHGCDQYLISPCSINQRDLVNQLKCIVKAPHPYYSTGYDEQSVENLLLDIRVNLKDSRNSAANLNGST